MSNRESFTGGFIAGTVVGGVIGGILGALLVSSRTTEALPAEESTAKEKPRQLKPSDEQSIEMARRGLEDKIAQLNEAIDDVRQQLSSVNGNTQTEKPERSLSREIGS